MKKNQSRPKGTQKFNLQKMLWLGYHGLLTLDELFTHLPCNSTHCSLGLHITLRSKNRAVTV